ncbi:MAG: hypothetical protein KJZ80_20610 [Hyphomicrobiaceae bacterium]|nr:hypothetical protein [Hyphomicrobiaceae bacterium]
MRASARHSTADYPDYGSFEADDRYASWELAPAERVCPPTYGGSGRARLRGGFLLLFAVGCGWLLLPREQSYWRQWLPAGVMSSLSGDGGRGPAAPESIERAMAAKGKPVAQAAPFGTHSRPEPVEPGASATAAARAPDRIEANLHWPRSDVPRSDEKLEADGEQRAPVAIDAAAAPESTAAAPLPPAEPEPADPYQMRAAAVGLHPGLSRVLLERLTPTDYRNAGVAVKTALADTPDDAVFVWPRQRKPELALFRVRFVAGAPSGCRRYVVTVVKDGWSTTALPMENCEPRAASSRASTGAADRSLVGAAGSR